MMMSSSVIKGLQSKQKKSVTAPTAPIKNIPPPAAPSPSRVLRKMMKAIPVHNIARKSRPDVKQMRFIQRSLRVTLRQ